MSDSYYDFVIDTRSYAGNFQRELCQHITGHSDIDDFSPCTDASPEYQTFMDEDSENVLLLPGGDGDDVWDCPNELYATPGWSSDANGNYLENGKGKFPAYNSVGIHFAKELPAEIIKEMKQRAKQFDDDYNIKITGFRLLKISTTREECEITID